MRIVGTDTKRLARVFGFFLAAALVYLLLWGFDFPAVLPDMPSTIADPPPDPSSLKAPEPVPQTVTDERGQLAAEGVRGYCVYVNLDKKRLFLYLNGVQVRNYPCAGGKAQTPSPTGTWRITGKSRWGKGFGGVWMGLDVPWGKYGIHGTKAPWLVGRSHVSKGCIRLVSENARELYTLVPVGTVVIIVYDGAPFRVLKNGDVGSDVLSAQKNLTRLGHYTGPFDGRFGSGLLRAVTEFQEENGLPVTGIIDKATYNAIMERLKSAPA